MTEEVLIDEPYPRKAEFMVTERFAGLAGLLPVFARKLRCVVVGEEPHTWQPRIVRLGSGRQIETGSVALPVDGGFLLHDR